MLEGPSAAFGRNQRGKAAGALPCVLSLPVRRILRCVVIAPGAFEGAMTRRILEGKALRTQGLQAGRQAIDTVGEFRRSAPRLGIRLAGPLPFSHSVGDLSPRGYWHGGQEGIVASA